MRVHLALATVALAALAGCGRSAEQARRAHADSASCAEAQVTVAPRRDVDAWAHLYGGHFPSETVKNDPAAYQAYKEKREAEHAEFVASGEVFEASGCGKKSLYFCKHRPDPGAGKPCTPLESQPVAAPAVTRE